MGAGPNDPETELRRSWAGNADAWTRAVRGGAIRSRGEGTDAAVLRAVSELEPRSVLDVGCGEGWLAHALAARGCRVTGLDGSEALVRAAREGPGEFHALGYDDLTRDASLLPGPFDAAVCNFSLLGEDLHGLLGALKARLSRDGRLVVQTVHPFTALGDGPYRDGWREERFQGFGAGFVRPMPWYYRTLASWSGVLTSAGFVVERMEEPARAERAPSPSLPLSLLLICRA